MGEVPGRQLARPLQNECLGRIEGWQGWWERRPGRPWEEVLRGFGTFRGLGPRLKFRGGLGGDSAARGPPGRSFDMVPGRGSSAHVYGQRRSCQFKV